jgi:hypothetical protein
MIVNPLHHNLGWALGTSTSLCPLAHTHCTYSYEVVSTPNEGLALKNCLVVHPSDFPAGVHVAVRNRSSAQREYPMTTWYVQFLLPD